MKILKCFFLNEHKTKPIRIVSSDISEVKCSRCKGVFEQNRELSTFKRLTAKMKKVNDELAAEHNEKFSK